MSNGVIYSSSTGWPPDSRPTFRAFWADAARYWVECAREARNCPRAGHWSHSQYMRLAARARRRAATFGEPR